MVRAGQGNSTRSTLLVKRNPEFLEKPQLKMRLRTESTHADLHRGTQAGLEGSLRVPFIIRWPGKIPAGGVSNEIVHEIELFTTFAAIVGGTVPTDRAIDGVDQSDFFLGKQQKSNRDGFVVYVGNEIFGVKCKNWKMMTKELEREAGAVEQWGIPRIFNLYLDPKEEHPLTYLGEYFWMRFPAGKILVDHLTSPAKYPPIRPDTPEPYTPPAPDKNPHQMTITPPD